MKPKAIYYLIFSCIFVLVISCSSDPESNGPKLTLKKGAGYTYSNTTIGKAETFKVGIIAEKTTADLLVYIVDYSVDGQPTMNSTTIPVTAAGTERFEYDIEIITRNQAGKEKWFFRISDVNGLLTTKEFTLTVQ